MTYCLGILLQDGLIMAADSRSNAGVDQVTKVNKVALVKRPGERVICILSAGNLATSQAVVTELTQASGSGDPALDLLAAPSLFGVARLVGDRLRVVTDRHKKHVPAYVDPTASFLVGGQLKGEPPRLFQIYSAGNFIEASDRACFMQIGETKYGKPILDRALAWTSSLDEAAKLALLSFDATLRSNLSVGMPIDLLRYEGDRFTADELSHIEEDEPYWVDLRRAYGDGLTSLVERLPPPPRPGDGPLAVAER